MSEKIDHVAKAIENELAYAIPQSAAYPKAASAAISAMREPTPEMRACVSKFIGDYVEVYQRMIDEALK